MEKVRFGIIGYGNMGSGHAAHFREGKIQNGVLTAICDINPAKIEVAKKVFGDDVKYFDTPEALFASGACDAVMVCTPHYLHPTLAIAAGDAGLHCIVEKPAGVYTLQVKEMLDHAKKSGKILGIMFNQRTNPAFRKMREMVLNGSIGKVKRTNWIITDWYRTQEYYDSGSWRATWKGEGGGVLYNQAPHQLDLFQWIVGMMPSKLRAFCHFGKWHDIEVEDDVQKPPCRPTVEVPLEGENSQHVGIVNNVANAILGLEPLYAPAEDGLCGVELANAMHLSTWLDREVRLPIDDELFLEELKKRIAVSKPHRPTDDSKISTQ